VARPRMACGSPPDSEGAKQSGCRDGQAKTYPLGPGAALFPVVGPAALSPGRADGKPLPGSHYQNLVLLLLSAGT
jgi:hypothetical protein